MKAMFSSLFKKQKSASTRSTQRSLSLNETTDKMSTRSSKESKTIKIQFLNHSTIKIELTYENAEKNTIGWLLEETKHKLREMDKSGKRAEEISRIVGLRTTDGLLSLDYLLTIPERTLGVFPKKISLQTVVSPENEGKKDHCTSLQDFELCGCLGKGAFARIYLGSRQFFRNLLTLQFSSQ